MNDKKNIDRLFQEKFKNFEVTPNDAVWEKIKARQEKGRKRMVILPFWYRAAGVAASIILILSIGYVSFNEYSTAEETIVNDVNNTKTIIEAETTPDKTFETNDNTSKEILVATEEDKINTPVSTETSQNRDLNSEAVQGNHFNPSVQNDNAIVTAPKKQLSPSKSTIQGEDLTTNMHSSNEGQIAENTPIKNNTPNNTLTKDKEETTSKDRSTENTEVANISNKGSKPKKLDSHFIAPEHQESNPNAQSIAEYNPEDSVSEKQENNTTEDIEIAEKDNKKSIFDAIDQKEEAIVEEETTTITKKWNISPNVAPVYYNVIGDGSSIDPQFSDNAKDGQVNLSYGVQIAYAINEKLSIRSGVSKVDLSYNTEDVSFTASTNGQNLQSINYSPNAEAILVSDVGNQDDLTSSDIRRAPNQTQNIGLLNQSIGYIEVPMEMKYALVNKKLGVNMIGGISTLFLQNNEISIEAGDFETSVGQANNLNEVSFSGNIGLGVDYKLSDHFQFNLEPIFKYQFNAFNGNAENFRPYYFGVYTGVSISF
ncbi:outer membrane beta-barrel protein [Aquimarina sp. 2304DJ70-9]|uniref:outer membrane beta-barrel protein n=1 Tax=Aquimarina penaris TaxID=3231044 RepID=UPI0034622CA1